MSEPFVLTKEKLTSGQSMAIEGAAAWYKRIRAAGHSGGYQTSEVSFGDPSPGVPRNQLFLIYGYAGTGKSTIVPFILDELGVPVGRVAFATYTGKAALVLTKKSGFATRTIHSTIYTVEEDPVTHKLRVTKKMNPELEGCRLIVLDEVSMVSKEIMKDLLSFGIPILCLGDPFQLPPVGGEAFFDDNTRPDFFLTEITRQALDNPIIWVSNEFRNQRVPAAGGYGGKVWRGHLTKLGTDTFFAADQMIVGYNRTRQHWNQWFRRSLGYMPNDRDILPVPGDKMICLRNNYGLGVVNGMMLQALDMPVQTDNPDFFNMTFMEHGSTLNPEYLDLLKLNRPERFGMLPKDGLLLERQRCYAGNLLTSAIPDDKKLPFFALRDSVEMDYGYSITAHKAQGSAWDKVLVLEEPIGRETVMQYRWFYTVATRAVSQLVLATSY